MSTDDLLDEATRLATMTQEDITLPWRHAEALAPIVRTLVERVRTAERSRDAVTAMYHGSADRAETAEAERDAARGKLDQVRALADEAPDNLLDELRTLLAILDAEGSVRPVGATGDDPATRVTPT